MGWYLDVEWVVRLEQAKLGVFEAQECVLAWSIHRKRVLTPSLLLPCAKRGRCSSGACLEPHLSLASSRAHSDAGLVLLQLKEGAVGPSWDIKHYYLLELKCYCGLPWCSSGWVLCFTAAVTEVSGWVLSPPHLHLSLAVLSPSAALGTCGVRCSVD